MKGVKVSKWGNGQGIRLPMAVMNLLSLNVGDELSMEIKDNKIVLSRKERRPMTLAERFASYDGSTTQEEFWNDEAIGKEVI